MDMRAAYDWARRLADWLDADITTYTIKHAVAFLAMRYWHTPHPGQHR